MKPRELCAWCLLSLLALGCVGLVFEHAPAQPSPDQRIDQASEVLNEAERTGKDSVRLDTVRGVLRLPVEQSVSRFNQR